jgi:hypothetical protein
LAAAALIVNGPTWREPVGSVENDPETMTLAVAAMGSL